MGRQIQQKEKEELITIDFNKSLYPLKAIKNAVKAYKELAEFSITEGKRYRKMSIRDCDKEIRSIVRDEFCNYVLSEVKAI